MSDKGRIENTDDNKAQIDRIANYAEKVQIASTESETICCQDTNIDLREGSFKK